MKYWAYLLAKLTAAGVILYGLRWVVFWAFPVPDSFMKPDIHPDPFAHDLSYTSVMLLYWLFAAGMLWAIVWDQRYRCRTCLRRLRMPVQRGSWTNVLL